MGFGKYLKKNWLTILSLTFGLTGIILAFYFHSESIKERKPIFLIDPLRTEIISSERIADAPVKVIRKDGSEIKSNLYSVSFYFWNEGKRPIKRENILEDIKIILDDPDGDILDYKILKATRLVSNINVSKIVPDTIDPLHGIIIDFDIVEKDDGALIQIIYEGNPEANFELKGIIEECEDLSKQYKKVSKKRIRGTLFHPFILIIPYSLIIAVMTLRYATKREGGVKEIAYIVLSILLIAIMIFLTYYIFINLAPIVPDVLQQ